MKILGIAGVILLYAVILYYGRKNFGETTNPGKYAALYYIVTAAGFLLCILDILKLMPDYIAPVIELYKKIMKQK